MKQHNIKSESVGLDYTAVLDTDESQFQSPGFQVNTGAHVTKTEIRGVTRYLSNVS